MSSPAPWWAPHRHLVTVARVLVVLVAVVAAGLPTATAHASEEGELLGYIAEERSARGAPRLRTAADLTEVAERNSRRMADQGTVSHTPNRSSQVDSSGRSMAENVGRASSVRAVHEAFMSSSGHASNIVDPRFTEVGVGVVRRDGQVWVTEIFRQPDGAPAEQEPVREEPTRDDPAPEPAPAPEPEPTSRTVVSANEAPSPDPSPAPAEPEPTYSDRARAVLAAPAHAPPGPAMRAITTGIRALLWWVSLLALSE